MFLVLDFVCLIVYNRQTLLEIGSTVTHRKPDFKFLNTTTRCLQTNLKGLLFGPPDRDAENDHQLPSILLANVQSLDNKLCELRDCSIICLTETCMSREVPDFAMEPSLLALNGGGRFLSPSSPLSSLLCSLTDIAPPPPPRPFASVRFYPLAWSSGSDQRRISGCGIRWLLAGPDSLPLWLCRVCAFVLLRCFSCSHTVLPKEHSLGIIFFLM